MSMHEVESWVELSVYCLDESPEEGLDRRSLFYNLYRVQQQFDTGFTHFRVMDTLIKHRFVYTFPISAHPAYEAHKAWFDALEASKKFSFIYEQPTAEWDAETNPVAGYANYDHNTNRYILYCDAGSLLWTDLVDNGTLTGKDAIAPEEIDVFTMSHEIAELAGEQKNTRLLASYYQLMPYIVMNAEQMNEPINYKALESILELVLANDAIDADTLPPSDELPIGGELGKFCEWWYAPAADKMKPGTDAAEEEIDLENVPFSENVEKSAGWYEQQVVKILQEANAAITYMEDNGYNQDSQMGIINKLRLALQYANKGLELAPGEPNLMMNKGSIFMLLQLDEEALAIYDEVLKLAPNDPYVHVNRAVLFYNMDQLPNAIAAFEEVIKLEPGNEFAQQWLARLKNGEQQ